MLNFRLNETELDPSKFYQKVKSSCQIHVFSNHETSPMTDTLLKESLMKLRKHFKYSDIRLKVGDEVINLHKCILAARSVKFKMMFDSNLKEKLSEVIEFDIESPELFKKMIDWIYASEIDFPDKESDIFDLIILSDEYFLEDLRRKCEDELLYRLEGENCL